MGIRETFASNLKRLCASKPSIAAVCRGTKINRQQFNRYLSGAALPNEKNLVKICRYFDIEESLLFRETVGTVLSEGEGEGEDSNALEQTDIKAVLDLISSDTPTSIPVGYHFAHFAHPHDPTSIMRSLLVIRRDGRLTTFRRLTGFSEKRGSWWSHFHGDHRGFILERRHWLYLIGLNSVGNNEPTQLVLRWLPNSDPILGGHATILTPIGPTVTAVVVSPCAQGTSLRSAIRGSHVYSVEDEAIEPIVLDALEQQCRSLIGIVRRLDLEVTPVTTGGDQFKEREVATSLSASSSAASSK